MSFYHDYTECDEIAEFLPIDGIYSYADAVQTVETFYSAAEGALKTNIAESLLNRASRFHPSARAA